MKGHVSKKGFGKASSVAIAILLTANMLAVSLASCTPAPATPPPTPATAPSPTAIAPQVATPLNPEDDAWAKVVEAARREGVLVAYVSAAFSPGVAQTFRDRYGIRIESMAGTGRVQLEKMKVEQAMKRPVADVFQTSVSSAVEALNEGLLDNVSQDLPALRDKEAFFQSPLFSPKGEIVGIIVLPTTPIINTKLVKPSDEPVSYFDLLDPKWKGKIIIEDPRGGGGSGYAWFTTMRHLKILDDDYFRRLGPQMASWGGSGISLAQMVARGEYSLSPAVGTTNVAPLILEGASLKQIEMKEGITTVMNTVSVIKNSSHPNAAKLFANWLLTKEGQTNYLKGTGGVSSVRKDVPDFSFPGLLGRPQKPLPRTWEVAQAQNVMQKEGIAEKLFGAK